MLDKMITDKKVHHAPVTVTAPLKKLGRSGKLEVVVFERKQISAPHQRKYYWSNVPALGNL